MEEFGLFLSYDSLKDNLRLPVNPETLEIKEAGDGKEYSIVGLGGINVLSHPKLTEISFESLFPAQRYPFVVTQGKLLRPFEYVDKIKRWMETRQPIRFVLSGLSVPGGQVDLKKVVQQRKRAPISEDITFKDDFGINMAVSIESFDWKLSAGNSGDIEYSLSLKEYVFYRAKEIKQEKGKVKSVSKRPSDKKKPRTYKLAPGDNLWSVAKKQLGDERRAKELQRLNGIKNSELTQLPIGKIIKLPQED